MFLPSTISEPPGQTAPSTPLKTLKTSEQQCSGRSRVLRPTSTSTASSSTPTSSASASSSSASGVASSSDRSSTRDVKQAVENIQAMFAAYLEQQQQQSSSSDDSNS